MVYRAERFRFLLMVAISLFGWLFIVSASSAFATTVTTSGRQILVDGKPFTIKGVGYAPVPICIDPTTTPPYGDYFTSEYSAIYNRDLPLLRQMGANTIRLWGWNNGADHTDFLDKAYNNGINPIYVIVTFWMGSGYDISDTNVRNTIKANFRLMVAAHKNHPAVLMWAIGNELNAPWMYGDKPDDLFSLIDEMAQEAHEEEGENPHPVTTPLADIDLINTIAHYDPLMPHLDVWSVQVYRGCSFYSLFTDYAAASAKPLAILEYNIDAYDNDAKDEYENIGTPYQATWAEALWNEIKANSAVCCGGSIMAYCDEWWKGKYGKDGGAGCPDYDPCFHSTCGFTATDCHPDDFANEEWWGIMRTVDNGAEPDIMQPRVVYYTLQSLWRSHVTTDFDGDGDSDIAVWRPSTGKWFIKDQTSPFWGASGDCPVPGDYNGDGTTEIGVWRPSNGKWYIQGMSSVPFGLSGDIPVPGEYSGDGVTDIAVWRPSNGKWYIQGQSAIAWGLSTDIPVPGDYDGDGTTEIGVWRPSNGRWYIQGLSAIAWGLSTDIPVPGDYDGDGTTEIGVWRPSNGKWYIQGQSAIAWGVSTDIPVPGDYDGDGTTEIGVWRPSNGRWYIQGMSSTLWGVSTDWPVAQNIWIWKQTGLIP